DRMEIIRLAGYTDMEKLSIARRYLVPKSLEQNGLAGVDTEFSTKALKTIIHQYTREAGVRKLEQEINGVARKVAKSVVKHGKDRKFRITSKNVPRYLGVPRFKHGLAEAHDQVGLVTGLAWTELGGELLVTEVTTMPGKGKLIITGKLGDVMQE